jgi:hypothetical protein
MPGETGGAFIYDVRDPKSGVAKYYVSPIHHDAAREFGLPIEGIMGELVAGPECFDPEHFLQNDRFVAFLHSVMARHAADCPGLQAEARRQREGFVYIFDGRTPTPGGEVPPEDIIGAVGIRGGKVLQYQPNPNYKILTAHGLIRLDPWFQAQLLEELKVMGTSDLAPNSKKVP